MKYLDRFRICGKKFLHLRLKKIVIMNRYHLLALLLAICYTVASAQVGVSINEQNMKIPRGNKPEPIKTTPQKVAEPDVTINTATLYYNLFDSAQSAITAQNFAVAETYFSRMLAADPTNENNSLVLSNLATVQRYQNKLQEALKNYNMAIDLTPNAVTLILNRAALLTQMDSLEYALHDYQRVIAIEPNNAEALYSHGTLSLQQGRDSIAAEDFNTLLGYDPNSGLAHQGLGNLYKARKNYRKAVQYYTDVIRVKPSSELLANRADCYLMLQQLNEASKDIQQALELTPDDALLYVLRAKLNKMRFNYEDVERDIKLASKYGMPRAQVEQMLK